MLGSKCTVMKELTFEYGDLSPTVLATALGPGKFPLLEKIDMYHYYHRGADFVAIDDDVILALCSSHPRLKSIAAPVGCSLSLSSVAAVLSHCPGFRVLNTNQIVFDTVGTCSAPPVTIFSLKGRLRRRPICALRLRPSQMLLTANTNFAHCSAHGRSFQMKVLMAYLLLLVKIYTFYFWKLVITSATQLSRDCSESARRCAICPSTV